jgi:hypothetical protein
VGLDYVYRDALMTVSATRSHEPDYTANAVNLDVSQEVFGGTTTVAMGFTRANDKVGRKDVGFFDTARHWRYRLGATQVLTPKWLMSVNGEAMSDDGYLGSPYRAARVFGALIPERNPRTRSGRAVELRAAGDMGEFLSRSAVRASYRYYWDNWSIRAHTLEFGGSRYIGDQWLLDAFVRFHAQHHALFYSDNATEETLYVSRNRQLGSFRDIGVGVKAAYTAWKVPGQYDVKVNGSIERVAFRYSDFTDLRDGSLYRFNANLVQLFVSATF